MRAKVMRERVGFPNALFLTSVRYFGPDIDSAFSYWTGLKRQR